MVQVLSLPRQMPIRQVSVVVDPEIWVQTVAGLEVAAVVEEALAAVGEALAAVVEELVAVLEGLVAAVGEALAAALEAQVAVLRDPASLHAALAFQHAPLLTLIVGGRLSSCSVRLR